MSPHSSAVRLSEVPQGTRVRILYVQSRPEISARLRELGFCEEAIVHCIARSHGNLICEVLDARIGLNMHLACGILVHNLD